MRIYTHRQRIYNALCDDFMCVYIFVMKRKKNPHDFQQEKEEAKNNEKRSAFFLFFFKAHAEKRQTPHKHHKQHKREKKETSHQTEKE